jgi:hypothetical protein
MFCKISNCETCRLTTYAADLLTVLPTLNYISELFVMWIRKTSFSNILYYPKKYILFNTSMKFNFIKSQDSFVDKENAFLQTSDA